MNPHFLTPDATEIMKWATESLFRDRGITGLRGVPENERGSDSSGNPEGVRCQPVLGFVPVCPWTTDRSERVPILESGDTAVFRLLSLSTISKPEVE